MPWRFDHFCPQMYTLALNHAQWGGSLRKHGSRSAFQQAMGGNWKEPYWAQMVLNVETNSTCAATKRAEGSTRLTVASCSPKQSAHNHPRQDDLYLQSLHFVVGRLSRFLRWPMDVLCMIEGKCATLGAKPVHLSGHLPPIYAVCKTVRT
jgi:hypothetical protein